MVSGRANPADPKVTLDRSSAMEVLDFDARIYLWRSFLTEEECEYLKAKAVKRLTRSGVVDSSSGGSKVDDVRTSEGMFFSRAEDSVIQGIEKRLADWTLLPAHYGEGLQVLRYQPKQKYDAHWDYFFHKEGTSNGGNRYATVLMYLADTEEGGETVFPKIPADNQDQGFSACATGHLAVKPRKGDALLFHSMKPTGELEERSMHGACPVIAGEKWSMTKWIHAKHYYMADAYDTAFNQDAKKYENHVEKRSSEF